MGLDTFKATYTHAQGSFEQLWDRAIANRETIIIEGRGSENIAILPEAELNSLIETAHLFRSPRNAERLMSALESALNQEGKPQSVESLAKEVGLGQDTLMLNGKKRARDSLLRQSIEISRRKAARADHH